MDQLLATLSFLRAGEYLYFIATSFILVILIGFYKYYSCFLKAKFPSLGKPLFQENFETNASQINYHTYAIAISISILLFIVYFFTSPAVYKEAPDGDAVYFTMMTVYADKPADLNVPITSLHGNRILAPILVHALVGRQLKQAIHEYEKLSQQKFTANLFYHWMKHESVTAKVRLPKINENEKKVLLKINQLVLQGFTIVNFIAFIGQIIFLLLILTYFRIPSNIALLICLIYSTFFISMRLYVYWPRMTDPLTLSFLLAGWYFMLEKKHLLFASCLSLGVLLKEQLLLLLVAFFFYNLFNNKIDEPQPNLKVMLARFPVVMFWSLIPVVIYAWLRTHPYFTMQGNVLPIMEQFTNHAIHNIGGVQTISEMLNDYIYLFQYHFYKLFSLEGILKSLLIPINVFGVLFFVLLARAKKVTHILYSNNIYMLFYILPYLLLGMFMVDRYIFYIIPVILILSALILSKLGSKQTLFFFVMMILINLLMMRFFGYNYEPSYVQTEFFDSWMIGLSILQNGLAWILFTISFSTEKKIDEKLC